MTHDADETMLICTSQPFCLCVGYKNEWDECCCDGNIVSRSQLFDPLTCGNCDAPLELIKIDSGETVRPAIGYGVESKPQTAINKL